MHKILLTLVSAIGLVSMAFRTPNINSYGILLDKKEVWTTYGSEKEVLTLSKKQVSNSDSLFVRAYFCGSQSQKEKTALVIKNEKGQELRSYTNNGRSARIDFLAGMPAHDLLKIKDLSENKTVSLYLDVCSNETGQRDRTFIGKNKTPVVKKQGQSSASLTFFHAK